MKVGDVVRDREADDPSDLLVVALTNAVASQYPVRESETVADYNAEFPADDPVVEVVYLENMEVERDIDDLKRYGFPVSRLSEEDDE
jgi:hypothetical protein